MAGIAIITGATGGIGSRFVEAVQGMAGIDEIWAVGRNRGKLSSLKDAYAKVVPVEADLAAGGTGVLASLIHEKAPDIRLLVNNAGVARMGAYEKMSPEEVRTFCSVNCSAPAELISIALPYMRAGARILNVSSASSFQPNPYLSIYSAGKVFLKNLSRAVGAELRERGITVTCVCPGWVDTDMLPKEKDGKKIRYPGMISAGLVVEKALKDSARGKDMSVPGFFAKYFRFYSKVVPASVVMRQWMRIIRRYV